MDLPNEVLQEIGRLYLENVFLHEQEVMLKEQIAARAAADTPAPPLGGADASALAPLRAEQTVVATPNGEGG